MRRIICLSLMVLFCGLFLGTSMTVSSLAAANQDQSAITRLIEKTKNDILSKKKREKSVLNSLMKQQQTLEKLGRNYDQVKNKLRTVERNFTQTREELAQLRTNLNSLQETEKKRRDILNRRLVVIYKYGPENYLELLTQAESFSDLINRFNTLSYFVKNDLGLLDQVQETKSKVEAAHQAVQAKSKEVEAEYRQVSKVRDQVSREQQKMARQVSVTKNELDKIQRDRAKLEKALEEYEATSREIEAAIRKNEQTHPTTSLGSGSMSWPVRGRISDNFGWRYHPILKRKKYHNGIDIAVRSGTPVLAADSGVVLVSGWQGGYGNFIAIDHGGGISSCYGHNSRLLVRVGERVTKGQVIAYSGSTGLSTGPHVHFEVRRNGTPVNPLKFLP